MITNARIASEDGLYVFQVVIKVGSCNRIWPNMRRLTRSAKIKHREIRAYCNETFVGVWGYANTQPRIVKSGDNIITAKCLFAAYEESDILALRLAFDIKIKNKPMWPSSTKFTIIYNGGEID